jgi:hypothetical protein
MMLLKLALVNANFCTVCNSPLPRLGGESSSVPGDPACSYFCTEETRGLVHDNHQHICGQSKQRTSRFRSGDSLGCVDARLRYSR